MALLIASTCVVVVRPPAFLRRPSLRQEEIGFRKAALEVVHPHYPEGLAEIGIAGVAVAKVQVEPSGSVGEIEILQSPHAEVSKAVSHAVRQWRFPVVKIPDSFLAARVQGKLTYYFVIKEGAGIVRTPDEQAMAFQMGGPLAAHLR
jgi:TonB family protein